MKPNSHRSFFIAAVLAGATLPLSVGCSAEEAGPGEENGQVGAAGVPTMGPGDTTSVVEEDVPSEDEPPRDDRETCGIPTKSGSCDRCGREECCEEQRDCLDEPECVAWIDCSTLCETMDCVEDCWTGSDAARQLSRCWTLACSLAC